MCIFNRVQAVHRGVTKFSAAQNISSEGLNGRWQIFQIPDWEIEAKMSSPFLNPL
jgi:hypothetical protein